MTALGDLDVSRETLERLNIYASALRKWNKRINLVAKSTIEDLWTRHFEDSAQLLRLAPSDIKSWLDLGSGGGFPGLVVAILLAEKNSAASVTLIESDHRKCSFLRSVLREVHVSATVIPDRIENVDSLAADIVSARALSDLSELISLAGRHVSPRGLMLFPKGKSWRSELQEAQSKWSFQYDVVKSKTSEESVILRISGVCRA